MCDLQATVDMIKNGDSLRKCALEQPVAYLLHYKGIERLHRIFTQPSMSDRAQFMETKTDRSIFSSHQNPPSPLNLSSWGGPLVLEKDFEQFDRFSS